MTTPETAGPSKAVLVDPPPGELVLPPRRVRPGTGAEAMPRFRDGSWNLALLHHSATARNNAFRWTNFPDLLRASFKRIGWAVINIPTPEILHSRLNSSTRPQLAYGTLVQVFSTFRHFARWLEKRQVTRISDVTQEMLTEYSTSLSAKGYTSRMDQRRLFDLTRAWAYAPFLLPQDRLVMPPWEDPGAAIADFLDDYQEPGPENRTEVVHPATMSPLLVWSLRLVLDLAPDILTAHREHQRLDSRIRPRGTGEYATGRQLVRDYLNRLRAEGRPIPAYTAIIGQHLRQENGPDRPKAATSYIAGLLNVTLGQVSRTLMHLGPELDRYTFGDGAPLGFTPVGTIDGKPWRTAVDYADVPNLALQLSTACLLTIGYLSGMRPEEILNLRRGCCEREEKEDGTVRYKITGRHFKGVTDKDGNTDPDGEVRDEPWTVIELVDRAVKVLEALHDDPLLFPRQARAGENGVLGQAVNPATARKRITAFITWANQEAGRQDRPHEMIPADPSGPVTLRRLRRTVAWFIYRRPGGRIALGLQYGHVGTSMAEGYGGRTTMDMSEVLDLEDTLAMADALAEASDRLDAGDAVSGPAAGRYIDAAREFTARFPGAFATKSQLKALRNNTRLRIFEDPDALLTCNYDPFKALCGTGTPGTGRAPDRDRCNPACANISRTDTHIRRAQAQIDTIDDELADPLLPQPLRHRQQQCREARLQIIRQHQQNARTAGTRT